MTQIQYDTICKIITNGAPALAVELCTALADLIKGYDEIVTENKQLKEKYEPATDK